MIYIVIWMLLVILGLFFEKKKFNKFRNFFYYINFIILFIFIGFRAYVFSDWSHYKLGFDTIESLGNLIIGNRVGYYDQRFHYDFGYKIYEAIIKTVTDNYFYFIILDSFIDILILSFVFFKYLKNPIFGFLFFISFHGLWIEMDLMRNSRAIYLFLLSLNYLKKNRKIKYVTLNILGSIFHITSIIYIAGITFLRIKIKKSIYIYTLIILFILMELRISILKNTILFISNNVSLPFLYKVNFYLNDSRWGSINYLSTIKKVEIIILIFVLFLYDNKIKKETYLGQILINITVSYLIIYLIAWDIKVFTERLSVLFVCFYWFLLADLFEILKNEKNIF